MARVAHTVMRYTGSRGSMRTSAFQRAGDSAPAPWIAPVFLAFHVNDTRGVYDYARHQHVGRFEVIIVDRGRYRCHLHDVALTLGPGELLVVKPGDWHDDRLERGVRFFSVEFHLEREFVGESAARLFRSTATPAQQRISVDRRIFWPIFRHFETEAGTRDQFASHVIGMSPAHAFMCRKIERAQWLRRTTDLTVKDISNQLGFENPYHFSRVFKRMTGCTPSASRARG